jgi:hypothetical protein
MVAVRAEKRRQRELILDQAHDRIAEREVHLYAGVGGQAPAMMNHAAGTGSGHAQLPGN